MTPNSEPLLGVEHAARIEFDDDAEHVVVLQQVGKRLQRLQKPGKDERIGPQACVDPEHTVRGRCPFFVVDDNTQYLSVRAGEGAALGWARRWPPVRERQTDKLKRNSSSPDLKAAASPRPATVTRRTTIA